MDWCSTALSEPLDLQLLRVGSGNPRVADALREHKPGGLQGFQLSRPVLEHWHASVGKNCAHVFALSEEMMLAGHPRDAVETALRERRVLCGGVVVVNLDCDNVMGTSYPDTVANNLTWPNFSNFAMQYRRRWKAVVWATGHPALTGRIGCWAEDWCEVGGYDEEPGVLPMGAQDVDLAHRLRESFPSHPEYKKQYQQFRLGPATSGFALPNDAADKKRTGARPRL